MKKDKDREAWTALVEGRPAKKPPKYGNERKGKYASKHEAKVAADLWTLVKNGKISGLREQVPFELVRGRDGVRGIFYIADFTFYEDGVWKVCDAKGVRTQVYILKRRMMFLIHGITIEEL